MSDRYAAPYDVPERDPNPPEHVIFSTKNWREPHVGGGEIETGPVYEVPLEGPERDIFDSHDLARSHDEGFELGLKCGIETTRCEIRERREAADERRARRSLILQTALLTTICVVIICVTAILTHG